MVAMDIIRGHLNKNMVVTRPLDGVFVSPYSFGLLLETRLHDLI